MKFIKKFYPYPIQVVGEDEQKFIICNYIKELFKDKNKIKELIGLFKKYENKTYIAKEFIDNFEKFDNFEEYFEDFGLSSCYNEKNELNRKELLKRNIKFERKSDKEIFDRILDNNLNAEFFQFTNLIIKFIDIFKNMLVDDEDYMFEKRIKEIEKEDFKYYCYSKDRRKEAECRIKVLGYLKEIYKYYQNYLLENHMIDYSDMINLSYKQIIKEVKNKYPELNYKYIIVDEYQDITFQRFLFVKRLVEYFNAKLISVGDDWQSIYAFAGSRLQLFNKFSELFLNSKDDMYLSTTYRYGQELADITSKFILENNEQSRKNIKSIKKLEQPIEICEYKSYAEYEEINRLVHKLYNENPNDQILILSRTNECLNKLAKSEFFTKGINDVLICKTLPEAKIEALTMHRSKGLTSDQVIVFGLKKKIFPNKGRLSHWLFEYFKLDSIAEQIPFAEERRLFYVALTRTRNKVYLVVPDSSINKSEFINEIENMINEKD